MKKVYGSILVSLASLFAAAVILLPGSVNAQFDPAAVANNTSCYQFNTNLSVGSAGADVVALQTWLIAHGFDIPAISSGSVPKGQFGMATAVAVQRMQKTFGMPDTGFVGPLTRGRLNNCNDLWQTEAASTVVATMSAASPLQGLIQISAGDQVTSNIALMVIDIKSLGVPTTLNTLTFRVSPKLFSIKAPKVRIGGQTYSGDVYETTGSNGNDSLLMFRNLAVPLPADSNVAATLLVDVTSAVNGAKITPSFVNGATSNSSGITVPVTSAQPLTASTQQFSVSGVAVTNKSAGLGSCVTAQNVTVFCEASYKFTLTAGNSTLYMSTVPSVAFATSSGGTTSDSRITLITANPGSMSGDTSTYYVIPAGASRNFVVSGTLRAGNGGLQTLAITGINYSTNPSNLREGSVTSDLEALKVPSVFGDSGIPNQGPAISQTYTRIDPIGTISNSFAVVAFRFDLTAGNSTLYVSSNPTISADISSSYADKDKVKLTSVAANPATLAGDTQSYFVVPAGTARTFVYTGQMLPDGSTEAKTFQLTAIRFGTDPQSLRVGSIVNGLENLKAIAVVTGTAQTPTTACYQFLNNFGVGSSGPDVVALQTFLINRGFDIPAISSGSAGKGYYGASTATAVSKFQNSAGLEMVGSVGPQTRAYLNKCTGTAPVSNATAPYISSVAGKAAGNFEIDAGGTVGIQGTNLAGYKDSTNVYIGGMPCTITQLGNSLIYCTAPSALTRGQSYDLYINNVAMSGDKMSSNVVKVKVISSVSSSMGLIVNYPNGGETFTAGQGAISIRYQSTGAIGSRVQAYLYNSAKGIVRSTAYQDIANSGVITIDLGKGGADPAGQYKVTVCSNYPIDGKDICDSSDYYFNLVSPATPAPTYTPSPIISVPAPAVVCPAGYICNPSGSNGYCPSGYICSPVYSNCPPGYFCTNMTRNETVSPSPVPTYSVTPSPVSIPAPTATLTVQGGHNYTFYPGQTANYYWNSTNADMFSSIYSSNAAYCGTGGAWSANTATGSFSSLMPTGAAGCVWTVTYTAKNSKTGMSASDTITVRVNSTPTSSSSPTPSSSPSAYNVDQSELNASIWEAVRNYFNSL